MADNNGGNSNSVGASTNTAEVQIQIPGQFASCCVIVTFNSCSLPASRYHFFLHSIVSFAYCILFLLHIAFSLEKLGGFSDWFKFQAFSFSDACDGSASYSEVTFMF
jgi:hypothetical protein